MAGKKGKKIDGQMGITCGGRGSPETSIEEDEGFNSIQKPAGEK